MQAYSTMKLSVSIQKSVMIAIICIVTFVSFRYTLQNQFTNWDDDFYVTNDEFIREFTPHNLRVIFTEDITKNNYHPLCMLSLAVNYHFSQLEPWSYYLTNILIHIANAVLVFFLFIQLCRRLALTEQAGLFTAFFGSLWFGIHPMHVESVAWIAERKDVLYAFFYIGGMISYLWYLDASERKWFRVTFVLFVMSCLSKPMAVVFPLSLLCIDFLLQRTPDKKLLTEKTVFFLTSLLCGATAFYTQHRTGAVASFNALSLAERIMYAAYGFIMYIAKLFNPTDLSTFYPYPYRYINGTLPVVYYTAPFLALAILILPVWMLYKRKSPYFRVVAFGIGFFLVNVIFVLQFISVGSAIMSDRYSYVAYIGLFFLLAYLAQSFTAQKQKLRTAMIAVLLLLSAGLAVLCAERTKVWHNSETLHTDAIEQYPYRALLSYKWRGHYYFSTGQFDKAMKDYGLLMTLHAEDNKVRTNVEKIEVLRNMQLTGVAFPGNAGNPLSRGVNYRNQLDSAFVSVQQGDTLAAFRHYVLAIAADPVQAEKAMAQSSNDLVQNQQYIMAIRQYNMMMKLNTTNPFYYFLRGCAHFGSNSINAAVADWETAVKMNVKDVQQSASYNLSVAYDSLGDSKKAYYYISKAQDLGYKPAPDFVAKLQRKVGK